MRSHIHPKFQFTLVITNPPMGRRILLKMPKVFFELCPHLPGLAKKGRFGLVSPFPEFLDGELLRLGLKKTFARRSTWVGFQ